MSKDAPSSWSIVEARFDPAQAKAYEGLFTLGSGYLHVRGSLEEHLAGQAQNVEYDRRPANVTAEKFREVLAQWGTYVPGVFAKHPTLNNQMVNLPWPLGLAPIVDGERLDAARSDVREWRRELSLRDGVLRRRVVWRTATGAIVNAEFERFVSMASPHLIVQRLTLRAERDCSAGVIAGIDADVRTNGFQHFSRTEASVAQDGESVCRVTTDAGDDVEVRSCAWAIAPGQSIPVVSRTTTSHPTAGESTFDFALRSGQTVEVHKRTRVSTSRDLGAAGGDLAAACRATYDDLLSKHRAAWSRRWELCDIEIDGDASSQLALRTALFHLNRVHVGGDARVAIDAKGFAGEAYWGRFFWDTEMYLLPFYLYTDPALARTLADFRVGTLPGARRNARRYGYAGARYAWESDQLGDECCPNWQYADHEVHVTAAVAYGLAHYAVATGDAAYLRGPASQVLVDTARYWMDRITFDDRASFTGPRLLGVMGPDEYKPITHDNAYTNAMVAHALRLASATGETSGASETDRRAWAATAAALPILRDAAGTLIMQCDGFDRLADPEFDRMWKDRTRPFAAQVSQELLYRSKALKQADVLMLMTLLPGEFTDAEVRGAWDYYLPYTTHDSSLSPGAHCLAGCRLGLHEEAWDFWTRGCAIDMPIHEGGHGGAAEGIHIAGAGAIWQMAVMGFAGVQSAMQSPDRLTLRPRLPRQWRGMSFPLAWQGRRVRVQIEGTRTAIRLEEGAALAIEVLGDRRMLEPGGEESFG